MPSQGAGLDGRPRANGLLRMRESHEVTKYIAITSGGAAGSGIQYNSAHRPRSRVAQEGKRDCEVGKRRLSHYR